MSTEYVGKCLGGPYDGEQRTHPKRTMTVLWLEGNPLNEIPFKRAGDYEWQPDIWVWQGPAYKPNRLGD